MWSCVKLSFRHKKRDFCLFMAKVYIIQFHSEAVLLLPFRLKININENLIYISELPWRRCHVVVCLLNLHNKGGHQIFKSIIIYFPKFRKYLWYFCSFPFSCFLFLVWLCWKDKFLIICYYFHFGFGFFLFREVTRPTFLYMFYVVLPTLLSSSWYEWFHL